MEYLKALKGLLNFLVGEYNPKAKKQIALIGKGVLFDSGGLSLKSPTGMETMKTDMAGAATAWGIIALVAKQGLDIGFKGIYPNSRKYA